MKFIKEPIKSWKLLVVLGILFFLAVPWYLPVGSYEPIIFGIPYWAWIVLFVSIAISATIDRKSTRLNSSHVSISYAVFCLKKKKLYSCRGALSYTTSSST